jgi:pimeloyl-ACP methyl ester carboxylesterase
MSTEQKVHKIEWSDFLVKILVILLSVLIIPHFLFWIPHWLTLPPLNLDLGWELNGNSALPSLLLNLFYLMVCLGFIVSKALYLGDMLNRMPIECTSDKVTFEKIQVPIGGGHSLPGDIIKGPMTPKKNAPVIILCHGLGGERTNFYYFAIPLSYMGFACILIDSRGHGENQGVFGNKWDFLWIAKDFSRYVDYIEKRAEEIGDLDAKEIIAWGASMGGIIVLNRAYLDERVKFIIAVCTLGDAEFQTQRKMGTLSEKLVRAGFEMMGINYRPTPLQARFLSPILNSFNKKFGFFDHPVVWEVDNDYRIMLAHCKDDEVLHYGNFEINKKFLNMPPENYIVFDTGNHAFVGLETVLVGKMLLWFWMRGY